MKTNTNFHNAAYPKDKLKVIIPLFITFLAAFLVLMGETGADNIGYSQTISTNSTNQANFSSQDGEKNLTSVLTNDTQSSNASGILSNSPITPQVKIISHTKGQEVPEGTLTVNGVSSDNSDSTCDVYVLLNGIKPYQRVTPVGQGGSSSGNNDFSLWNFTFLPTYGLITEGDNRMTAKITCITGNTNATKFNSLNVTGIASNRSSSNASTAQTPDSLQSINENITDNSTLNITDDSTFGLSDSNSTSNYTSSQQAPAMEGVIPKGSQANYSGLSPSYTQTNKTTSAQNSSLIQQEEQAAPNNSLAVDGDSEQDGKEQSPANSMEISDQTKKAVDEFIGRVQGTVEERLQEALKMRVPFELAIPTP